MGSAAGGARHSLRPDLASDLAGDLAQRHMGLRICSRWRGGGSPGPVLREQLPEPRLPARAGPLELVAAGFRGAHLRAAPAGRRRVLRPPLPGARKLEREARAAALRRGLGISRSLAELRAAGAPR